MKKTDVMGYLCYALMLAIAVTVGLTVVRPIFSDTSLAAFAPMNQIGFVILAVLAGVIINAVLIEVGHLVGAKIGKYKVISWCCLGFCFKRNDKDKMKFCFSNFEGITGDTKIVPLDEKKSNPKPMIYFPLLFLLLEVVGCVAVIAMAGAFGGVWFWWKAFVAVILAIAGMLYLYDIFPAALDNKNDGYLLTILTNETNKVAYNQILIAENKMASGEKVENSPIYDKVTNFTFRINNVSLYQRLAEEKIDEALAINEKTIASKDTVSTSIFNDAVTQKVALTLAYKPLAEGKEMFIALPLDQKKYIASMNSAAAVRAYILISGLVEDSITETKLALDRVDASVKKDQSELQTTEEKLMKKAIDIVIAAHPDWDFSDYGLGKTVEVKKEEPKPEEKTEVQDSKETIAAPKEAAPVEESKHLDDKK